jgi:hypothetical protein
MRVVPTHRASGRPAQRRIDHAGSNCAVAEFDLRANSRCILGARPAPHQKALSGARHRQPDRRNGTDFADGDFLVACHHGSWIGSRYEALTSRRALSTSSASLSSMRMTLLFAAPSKFVKFGVNGLCIPVFGSLDNERHAPGGQSGNGVPFQPVT